MSSHVLPVIVIYAVITIFGNTIAPEPAHSENVHLRYIVSKNVSKIMQRSIKGTEWRLPKHTIPIKYELFLNPNLEFGRFKGTIIITINNKISARAIKIHSKNLNIQKVYVDGKKAKVKANKKYEMLIITLYKNKIFTQGEHEVNIRYNGQMGKRNNGFYNSTYIAENGEKRSIATTQFEATYARQTFPCFDEPNMKANFTIHILRSMDDSSYIALSNMPQKEEETVKENGIMVHFKESVKMSTYLVCFIVCDFKYSETIINSESGKIPLRVYAAPNQVGKTQYALNMTKSSLQYYEKYFDIKYPLPKLDLIAIPDFQLGAMENWGLITFRETSLLFDEKRSSIVNKLGVALTVSHELAHMWFGNLVTMQWWSELWLNEGFARYFQYKAVDAIHKDWKVLDQFLLHVFYPVLSVDATLASHPIIKNVVTPSEIIEVFDYITYGKGASILRMLEATMGEEKFQTGIRGYLNKFKLGNANTQDLWNELQEVADDSRNLLTVMDTWITQIGYPILTVEEKEDHYLLTQKRFLKDSSENTKGASRQKWIIPITYITDKDQGDIKLVWFDNNEDYMRIEKPDDIKWIKFNHKQTGVYRVNYPEDTWKILANNINNMLEISDKTHLLEESFSIAESSGNILKYNVPLDLTKYLKNETHYIPWSVAGTKLRDLKIYLVDSLEYSKYMDYFKSIVKPVYDTISWDEEEGEGYLTKRARLTILDLACSIGLPECTQEALKRFQVWLKDPQAHPLSDLRTIVQTYGMEQSGREAWEKVLEIFQKETDAGEKVSLMRGLASVKELWLLERLIELAKDEEIIRGQDYFSLLHYVSANPIGTLMVWDYVRENWNFLVGRFGINDINLGKLIQFITKTFVSKIKLNEMKEFFKNNPNEGATRGARKAALAQVKHNIKWIERNREDVIKWLNENVV